VEIEEIDSKVLEVLTPENEHRRGLQPDPTDLSSAKIASAEPAAPIMLLWHHERMVTLLAVVVRLVEDALQWLVLLCRSTKSLEAENLFLRRQLALYIERGVRPRRLDVATRVSLVVLSKLFDWRNALVVVQPATLIGWHRAGWKLLWRVKSRRGRPPIPMELRELIRRMARENVLWGEERIANELLLKLGIRISPRTVRKYMPRRPPGQPRGDLRWSTFLKSHARGILACDFFVAVTATLRMLYVFVVIEHGTRRLAHVNVTTHPSAAWTLQQLREVIANADAHRYLIHDRDSIFARHLDDSIRALGLAVLRSPFSSPKANAICERVIGTIRRECLDWTIPMSEAHFRSILRAWVAHYNGGRPHSALGPGVPGPPAGSARAPKPESRRLWTPGALVRAKSVLGGLHHEYAV
jgi:putative transposase